MQISLLRLVFVSMTALQGIQISSVKSKDYSYRYRLTEIDKNVTINVPIVGDLKRVLTELNTFVEPTT